MKVVNNKIFLVLCIILLIQVSSVVSTQDIINPHKPIILPFTVDTKEYIFSEVNGTYYRIHMQDGIVFNGSNIYMGAMELNPDPYIFVAKIYIFKVDIPTMNITKTYYVGTTNDTDPHNTPFVRVLDNKIHVSLGYGRIWYWVSNFTEPFNFIGGMITKNGMSLAQYNFCYPFMHMYNGEIWFLVRSIHIASTDGWKFLATNGTFIDTIWNLAGQGYYCQIFPYGDVLYVSAVGRKIITNEVRENIYFGKTYDLKKWYSMNGTEIQTPEIVYLGNTSRCTLTVDYEGSPIISFSYVYFDINYSEYKVVRWTNNKWQVKVIPTTEGYATMFPTNALMIRDYVHMSVTTFPALNEETRVQNLCNITYTRFKPSYNVFETCHIATETSSGAYSYYYQGILYIATWKGTNNELHIYKIGNDNAITEDSHGGLGRSPINTR